MKSSIRILHLEVNPKDAELVRSTLEADGLACEVVRVETQAEFVAALEEGGFDLILSDFSLPSFDGLSALTVARRKCPDVPFIIVSGMIGEESAVITLQHGATDYLVKQRLTRLGPAVHRALREAEERIERQQAEEALRQSQEQLRQSQKMEAIVQLAGGIAHDFNNLLTVITGYSELMLQTLAADDLHRGNIEQIRQAGERAAALTRQLLAFSRKQVLAPTVLDLNAVVTNMDSMLRRVIGEDIELVSVPAPGLGRVQADQGQLEQVIVNLAVNARDAMPQGGRLTIETANVELDDAYARRHVSVKPGPYVMLAVSDTGCGMDAETQSRIFEPFFTSKERGKGTGLGLATVYGIVKQSGGNVWVYSEPGQGATFKIYLPRIEETVMTVEPESAPLQAPRGSETVLLVEDEEGVRTLVRTILQTNGYTVLEARHGKEAFFISGRHEGPIHLMVTDVVMPGMSGQELADRLKSSRPDMKVLFLSGYTDEAVVRHGVLKPGTAFLQKPFTPGRLARKARLVLDGQ